MNLAIIGEYNDNFRPHKATNEAIEHVVNKFGLNLEAEWISTDTIENNFEEITKKYNGFWIAPGSPYKSMTGGVPSLEVVVVVTAGNYNNDSDQSYNMIRNEIYPAIK
jgi:CTP synthase (UTP-ammonia lyase)